LERVGEEDCTRIKGTNIEARKAINALSESGF